MRAGILGAGGYAGAELIRIVNAHPDLELVALESRSHTGKSLAEVWPQLSGNRWFTTSGEVIEASDLVFLALPHGTSGELAVKIAQAGKLAFDLSADLRLPAGLYSQWYQKPAPDLKGLEAIYGLVELHRAELEGANLVAVPGCYPTAAILALAPLAKSGLIGGAIVSATSGVSGAGRGGGNGFSEVNENYRPYSPATHRHTPEIETQLSRLAGQEIRVSFVPHLAPMTRGILASCFAEPRRSLSETEINELYQDFYSQEPFIQLSPELPQTKGTWGSNRVWITPKVDLRTNRVMVFAALDNLIKGAAGQAVQAANVALGLPETAGLNWEGIYP